MSFPRGMPLEGEHIPLMTAPASPSTSTSTSGHRGRRHFLPLVWMASAVSAAVLLLGVNGTLSAWTSAVLENTDNTAATANALILQEVGPDASGAAQTCFSSSGTGNSYSCTTINKYGGTTAAPLSPGQSRTVDVTFTNVGEATGASFTLAADTCGQTPAANGAATPPINNLCTATGELTVAVACSDGAAFVPASAYSDLVYPAGPPSGIGTLVHTSAIAADASITCRFTVALNASASVTDQGIVVSQALTWTLA